MDILKLMRVIESIFSFSDIWSAFKTLIFLYLLTLKLQILEIREAVEEAADSQALLQIQSQV